MAKPGKLTIGLLLGKPEKGDEPESDSEHNSESMEDEDNELPPGLLEAVTEFRTSESDEDAAKAFHRAMQCCEEL